MPILMSNAGRVSASVAGMRSTHKLDRLAAVAHRAAELALRDRPEIAQILLPDRIVEAPGFAEGRDDLRRRVRPEDDLSAGSPESRSTTKAKVTTSAMVSSARTTRIAKKRSISAA